VDPQQPGENPQNQYPQDQYPQNPYQRMGSPYGQAPGNPYGPMQGPRQPAPNRKRLKIVGLPVLIIIIAIVAGLVIKGVGDSGQSTTCTTNSCIATDIGNNLVNIVAEDKSVITSATCDPSTVTGNGSGTWTATCTATYSDGSTATGYGTLDTSQNEVTFEPSGS